MILANKLQLNKKFTMANFSRSKAGGVSNKTETSNVKESQ